MDLAAVFTNLRGNAFNRWAPSLPNCVAGKILPDDAVARLQEPYARVSAGPSLGLAGTSRFFCLGSCFAREIEEAIDAAGARALTRELFLQAHDADPFIVPLSDGKRPTAFLNRFNAGSMLLELQRITGEVELGSTLIYKERDTYVDLHYTRRFDRMTRESAVEQRQKILDVYRAAFAQADVFIFTFGLCEAFYDSDAGQYLNVTPMRHTEAGSGLEFRFISYEENVSSMRRIIHILRSHGKSDIIFTVSPVPLAKTFSGMDVVVANQRAKATLLAAVHEVCAGEPECHYFPSFEMVTHTNPARAWKEDRQHVREQMVEHIMNSFMHTHLAGARSAESARSPSAVETA